MSGVIVRYRKAGRTLVLSFPPETDPFALIERARAHFHPGAQIKAEDPAATLARKRAQLRQGRR